MSAGTAMTAPRAPVGSPAPGRRLMITICVMMATIMQVLDITIANVSLPYMQGSLSATLDQVSWVLTSYVVAAAVMTAPVGWLAARFGIKKLLIVCVTGFTVASMLCGIAQSIEEMVLFRMVQGMFGAALVPLSQTVMLEHLSARAARLGHVAVGHRRHDRPDHGADPRRPAHRVLLLALDLLHQRPLRHRHRARPDGLHGRDRGQPPACRSTGSASPRSASPSAPCS